MKRMRRVAFMALSLVLVAVGFLIAVRVQEQSISIDPRLVKADNEFAFKLFREVMKGEGDRNVFISPASIALALHMTYNGASGETKKAMAETLGIQGMTLDELNRANADLLASLVDSDPKVQLYIANSLWVNNKTPVRQDFVRRGKESYRAEVESLDFGSPSSASRINSWIARQTKGEISDVVGRLDSADAMELVNAIYFRGIWTSRFDPKDTRNRPFFLISGKRKDVPMMHQTSKFARGSGPGFDVLRMPYGKERLSMYVCLPDRHSSLEEMMDRLDHGSLEGCISRMSKGEVWVDIPRFRTEFTDDLESSLSRLGMAVAFDRRKADFSDAIPPPDGWLSKARHNARIEVDEEGTRAKAVTLFKIRARGGHGPFVADRPFFYAIRDDKTGLILFMGVVTDPAPEVTAEAQ